MTIHEKFKLLNKSIKPRKEKKQLKEKTTKKEPMKLTTQPLRPKHQDWLDELEEQIKKLVKDELG